MSKRSKLTVVVLALLAIVFVCFGVTVGCDAHRRPPALNEGELQLLREAPLPYTLVVKPWDRELADVLISSRAFRTSRFEPRALAVDSADLIAISTGMYCNSVVIPLYTL